MSSGGGAIAERDVALVDLVDRLLGGGVVIAGDITLAVADVDLVHISLRALVSSVETARPRNPNLRPASSRTRAERPSRPEPVTSRTASRLTSRP